MALLRLDKASLAYGDHPLLDGVDLAIEANEKIALLGRNGMGKSTLMRVLAGVEKLDSGSRVSNSAIQVTYLSQDLPEADDTTAFDYMAQGLAELGELLSRFEVLTHGDMGDAELSELETIQQAIEAQDGWRFQQRIYTSLSDLGLPPETTMGSLSGGWRRRVAISRAFLSEPDILLLDEPTNHLDIPAIEWLQQILLNATCSLVLITHDRRFMNDIASRIWWLDRGNLMSFEGNYHRFLEQRDAFLENEERQNALFDKRLAEEEKWIRQGIKARRTRNEGRVRALKAMRQERSQRINVRGNVNMQLEEGRRSGKIVAELENVNFAYEEKPILRNVNLLVQRQDRIALIGKNGAGKSTLLKIMLGQLQPTSGTVELGSKLEIAYFDQMRDQLDDNKTVADNVSDGRDMIEINGQQKHIISYLGDFLFTPRRVRSPVSTLSGGEKNRLLLAKLFSKPANLLFLDEPTNDLDIETLELLEELIDQFQGTVIVASHDREFVDQIVTSTVFIDDDGYVHNYVGGFEDLVRQHGELWPEKKSDDDKLEAKAVEEKSQTAAEKPKAKLSYNLQRELEQLPGLIEKLEQKIETIELQTQEPDFFQKSPEETTPILQQLADKQNLLEQYFERWQELDEM